MDLLTFVEYFNGRVSREGFKGGALKGTLQSQSWVLCVSGGIRQAPVVTVRDIPTQLLSHADGGFFEPLAVENVIQWSLLWPMNICFLLTLNLFGRFCMCI